MTPLVFIDTETTGVHPDREVWEIAMIRRYAEGEQTRTIRVEVDLRQADPYGLKVGRFYDRHPLGRWLNGDQSTYPLPGDRPLLDTYLTPAAAAQLVARITHGAHLVGLVPSFDAETLDKMLRRYQLIPAWHYHLIDVEAMAIGYLHGLALGGLNPDVLTPPTSSDELSRVCGVEPPGDHERHTAYGDARWAMRWYDHITGGDRQ